MQDFVELKLKKDVLARAGSLRTHLKKLGGHSQCWPTDQEFRDSGLLD
jgi:hypothetical protein